MQVNWSIATATHDGHPQMVRGQPPCQAAGGLGRAVLSRGSWDSKELRAETYNSESVYVRGARPSA